MKAKYTVWAGLLALAFAQIAGCCWVAWRHFSSDRSSFLFLAILFTLLSLACYGASRIEDDHEELDGREQSELKRHEREVADIARRRKALS